MPEPLKNLYSAELINALSMELLNLCAEFDAKGFIDHVFDHNWENRDLKQRMAHISRTLHKFLPGDYPETVAILKKASSNFSGFEYMFFPGFVELYGIDNYAVSIPALEHFTEHASPEFSVRPFIKIYGKLSRKLFKLSESENTSGVKKIARYHSFRKISTRKYYVGTHGIAFIVSGHELVKGLFQLNEKVR